MKCVCVWREATSGKIDTGDLTDKETFEPRPEGRGRDMKISEENDPERRDRRCKGLKWEACLMCWKNRKEATWG